MALREMTCPACGSTEFEEGFVDDVVHGQVRWVLGEMRIGLFGGAKHQGPFRAVQAFRCVSCSRLELYGRPPAHLSLRLGEPQE